MEKISRERNKNECDIRDMRREKLGEDHIRVLLYLWIYSEMNMRLPIQIRRRSFVDLARWPDLGRHARHGHRQDAKHAGTIEADKRNSFIHRWVGIEERGAICRQGWPPRTLARGRTPGLRPLPCTDRSPSSPILHL